MSTTLRRGGAIVLSALLLLAACGDDDGDGLSGNVVEDGMGCSVASVDRAAEAPAPEVPAADAEPLTEAVIDDLEEPEEKGCESNARRFAQVDMVGVKASDGTEFVNTFGEGRPVNLRIGQGQLISGLETALADMKVGGRRQVTIPPDQAYGEEGNEAQGIGPDETLVFVVDLFAVTDEPDTCNTALPIPTGVREGKPTSVEIPAEPWTELTTTDLVEGTGEPVGRDIYVRMEYLGVGCFSGAQFDSSWDREEPISVALGEAEQVQGFMSVIPGWTDGIEGMKVGGLRQINIPAELAYGERGSEPDIAPNEPLIFVVQLVEVVESPQPPTDPGAPADPTDPGAVDPGTVEGEGATTTTVQGAEAEPEGEGDPGTTDAEGAGADADGDGDDATTTTSEADDAEGSEDDEG